jgi:hypothetical protein
MHRIIRMAPTTNLGLINPGRHRLGGEPEIHKPRPAVMDCGLPGESPRRGTMLFS